MTLSILVNIHSGSAPGNKSHLLYINPPLPLPLFPFLKILLRSDLVVFCKV